MKIDDGMPWRARAKCFERGSELFYTDDNGRHHYAEALRVCLDCDVRQECLEYALTTFTTRMDFGVWGGTTPHQRARIRAGVAKPPEPGECANCGDPFFGYSPRKRFCSESCRKHVEHVSRYRRATA